MEELPDAARQAVKQRTIDSIPDLVSSSISFPNGPAELWQEISAHKDASFSEVRRSLLIAQESLKAWAQEDLSGIDKSAINSLYNWAGGLALPSPVFAESSDESSSTKQDESRQQSTLALSVISLLAALLPIHKAESAQEVLISLASFTSEMDTWTTPEAYTICVSLLNNFAYESNPSFFWATLESTLKSRIKPLFAKTKNPAITDSGRKNFHPVPLPRFDLSVWDPETKPWKMHDVHITTVFSWIVNQYQPTDRDYLEAHFPLLVPPILALIDDDSLSFKRRGCLLLSQLLIPIRDSKSDILRRTNLSSVFEDAIRPCFHSLPTITPEDDSIQLLAAAYPALQSLLQTSYKPPTSSADQEFSARSKNEETFVSTTSKTLRDHLIPSFHHISSTNTTSASTFASFPHPRLSTLLLDRIATTCTALGIHTTKYLQDIIPLVYSTLSNPFGTAHPPLLLSAVVTARVVILNAYPRIWRWRGELLGTICSCWLHVIEDDENVERRNRQGTASTSSSDENKAENLRKLKKELQGLVYLLRYALENPVEDGDRGQMEAKEKIAREVQMLVEADDNLKECLLADVDSDDPGFFGLNPMS